MLRSLEDMKSSLDLLRGLQQQFWGVTDQTLPHQEFKVPFTLQNKGDGFELTLETKDFSADELSVKSVSNKLQVSGKSEAKNNGSNKTHEFKIEFMLPEEVNPEAVTCSFAEGKLCIQVPGKQLAANAERNVPINKTTDSTKNEDRPSP